MVDGSSDGSLNGPILAHQMPLAGAVHHITEITKIPKNVANGSLTPLVVGVQFAKFAGRHAH
jgi:hypothetical protein